jgi:uncharacterized repeat protein (TIGR02543 family)
MATYFVATNGNDSNPGTIEQPWLNLLVSFRKLNAGDTLYIRDGIYYTTGIGINSSGIGAVKNGTSENPIVVSRYQNEVPIIDRSIGTTTGTVMFIQNLNYWKFFGIIFQNSHQFDNKVAEGVVNFMSRHLTFEQCIVRNVTQGFRSSSSDYIYYINCDVYNAVNTIAVGDKLPGTAGQGFSIEGPTANPNDVNGIYYEWMWGHHLIEGCRIWDIANSGYSLTYNGRAHINNSWAYNVHNRSFLTSFQSYEQPSDTFIVTNSIALYPNRKGFVNNNNSHLHSSNIKWYNNIVIRNQGIEANGTVIAANSAFKLDMRENLGIASIIIRNNVDYQSNNSYASSGTQYNLIKTNNTFDIPLTLTDADFVGPMDEQSLVAAMLAPRKADGSLPDFTNLWPSETSQLRNAGVDVGLPYEGIAPDLGPFQYQTLTSQYTLTRNVTGSGSIVATPNLSLYENENVSLLAVPATGWEFTGWSGDLSGTTNPQTLLMDGNKTVNAAFSQIILPPPNVFDNWSILSYPVLQSSISGNVLVSNLNTTYLNNNINLNELKTIVEVLIDINVLWNNTPIRTINVSMKGSEIRGIINTNTETLYENMVQLYNAIKAYTTINVDNLGWITLETKLLLNPSSSQFARTHNWNTDILKRNTTLLYDLLKSYYLD